jgi:hypothetical protein
MVLTLYYQGIWAFSHGRTVEILSSRRSLPSYLDLHWLHESKFVLLLFMCVIVRDPLKLGLMGGALIWLKRDCAKCINYIFFIYFSLQVEFRWLLSTKPSRHDTGQCSNHSAGSVPGNLCWYALLRRSVVITTFDNLLRKLDIIPGNLCWYDLLRQFVVKTWYKTRKSLLIWPSKTICSENMI